MKRALFLCVVFVLPSLCFGQTCGDLNDDANIDLDDYSWLTDYMFHGGPLPIGDADMDECGSVNIGDAWYLIQHLWVAGDPPCEGSVTCVSPTGGNSIDLGCPIVVQELTGDSIPIPVYMTNTDTIRSASLGFTHNSADIEITSVSFIGSMTSTEVGRGFSVDPSKNEVVIYWNSAYDQIRPQTGGLFATMWAQVPMDTPDHLVDFDTTFVGPACEFLLCPVNGGVLTPAYNDCGEIDLVIMTSHPKCGDLDCGGDINIADLTYLVSYLFTGGNPPCDPDGDGSPECLK
ncbi:MAG: hypothetical protein KOO62_00170 [candidate division Zixibacteria bacterium]|nr:hypothetical protein [candidate division Zixibacteria bacterium]